MSVVLFVSFLALGAAGQEPAAPQTGTAAAPDGAAAYEHPDTYLEFAVAGGPVMIPIGLCSVFFVAYLIERLISTRKNRVLPPPLVEAVRKTDAEPGGVPPAKVEALCAAHPSPTASVLRAALERLGRPREEIERRVNSVAHREVRALRRNIRLFAIIASVAPLLGLLGTVTGMIQSFREVAIHGLGAGRNLAPGIYEALITTAAGLFVAIPSLLTYYWLNSRVDGYVNQIDGLVVGLVDSHQAGARA